MSTYKTSTGKESILKKIRTALNEAQTMIPYPNIGKPEIKTLFNQPLGNSLEEDFVTHFIQSGGTFIFCENANDFVQQLNALVQSKGWKTVLCAHKQLFSFLANNQLAYIREFDPRFKDATVAITDCEAAVARTGSLILSSHQNYGRMASINFPVHIVVLQPHQILPDISDALKLMKQKYNNRLPSMININTGPSRTADIEKTLVTGVHGPKEVYCFLLNS